MIGRVRGFGMPAPESKDIGGVTLPGSIPPLTACAICGLAAGLPVIPLLAAFAMIWYGAEILLAHMAGWHLSWRSPLSLIIRDLLLPALWLTSWLGDEFVWRGNKMRVVGHLVGLALG